MGSAGELLVEGPALARGYFEDVEKTNAAFIEAPAWMKDIFLDSLEQDKRMYKTGDLVRYTADGTLQFLGRKDSQVKFHGQRLELNEIEQHVKQLVSQDADVAAELVLPQNGPNGGFLAVFLALSERAILEINVSTLFKVMDDVLRAYMMALQAKLRETLPAYMVPTVYLPLTTSH